MTFLTIEVRDAGEERDTHGFRDAPAERPVSAVELDDAERAALAVLASSGLVPPLRLVPRERAG
ncbi:hypothetical protein [Pengzhenrongella phosphoraccumulans]|uniref:hypothetical protein n=1 Tax=Pengzhenrongella phosphoraccumulans TaxID=3114394 RepID=UPI00388DEFA2